MPDAAARKADEGLLEAPAVTSTARHGSSDRQAERSSDPNSRGLWERSAPAAPPTGRLKGEVACDVVVIGAGYTGLSAALHLAESGRSVVVVDANDIGHGGSGRNVGLVNAGMWVMPQHLIDSLGERYGGRVLDLLGGAPSVVFDLIERWGIACEAERSGTLHCAVGESGWSEIVERGRQWQALGAPVTVLDAAEAARKIGSDAYKGALLDARAGTIQPLAYARGLAAAANASGVQIFSASPATAIEDNGRRLTVRTPDGSASADWVIVATNAYTSRIWPELKSELVRLPYFNFATPPLGENLRMSILPERQGAWDTKEVLSSFRLDRAGRLIFGSVGALRGTGASIHRAWSKRALRRLFPQLEGISFETEWYGWIGMTQDNLPLFHRLARNVVSVSGYNGRGIAPGTVFGRCLAQLILGQLDEAEFPLPTKTVAPVRFKAAREAYYELGAQAAHFGGARF